MLTHSPLSQPPTGPAPNANAANPTTTELLPFSTLPSSVRKDLITPFQVSVPETALTDMAYRVELSKLPPQTFENGERKNGVTHSWMSRARNKWISFDWKRHEKRINQYPQYKAQISDAETDKSYSVHFMAAFSPNPDAVPIILCHGWPGSFLEFLPIMSLFRARYAPEFASETPLHTPSNSRPPSRRPSFANAAFASAIPSVSLSRQTSLNRKTSINHGPSSHPSRRPSFPASSASGSFATALSGLRAATPTVTTPFTPVDFDPTSNPGGAGANPFEAEDLPYHIIIPSMPGYAFSDPPPDDREFKIEDVARIYQKLMVDVLGFKNGYVAQGGGLGSVVARVLASSYDECKAVHFNTIFLHRAPSLPSLPNSNTGEAKNNAIQRDAIAETTSSTSDHSAYAMMQGARAGTMGFVLASSPIALLAWLGEKHLDFSDEEPSLQTILLEVSLYWLTETMVTGAYPFRQLFSTDSPGIHDNPSWYLNKPMGYSSFPQEVTPVSKEWAETTGNLEWFREHERGGSFVATEQPETLLQDIEDFVAKVWKK